MLRDTGRLPPLFSITIMITIIRAYPCNPWLLGDRNVPPPFSLGESPSLLPNDQISICSDPSYFVPLCLFSAFLASFSRGISFFDHDHDQDQDYPCLSV